MSSEPKTISCQFWYHFCNPKSEWWKQWLSKMMFFWCGDKINKNKKKRKKKKDCTTLQISKTTWEKIALEKWCTLDDEMNFGGLWFLVCEDGAHVWPFVMQVHIQDFYTVLCHCCVIQQDHSRVQRPFLTPREENSGAIQPSYPRYLAVHIASETQKKIELSH